MSTTTKPQQPLRPTPRPTSTASKTARKPQAEQVFLFDKDNYMLMIGGVVLILIGFMLLSGGKSPDPHQFNYEEIYSFRRITLAPLVIMAGFVLEVYAIMKKPKVSTSSEPQTPAA